MNVFKFVKWGAKMPPASPIQIKNLYKVLELPQSCSGEEVRDSFIKLARKYDPERKSAQSSPEKFAELYKAYNVLIDPSKRRRYDLKVNPNTTYDHSKDVLHRKYNNMTAFKEHMDPESSYYINHWREKQVKQRTKDVHTSYLDNYNSSHISLWYKSASFKSHETEDAPVAKKKEDSIMQKINKTCNEFGIAIIFAVVAQCTAAYALLKRE